MRTTPVLVRWAAAVACASILALGPAYAAVAAAACHAESGRATTPVVELYTSEGCDSCPPADRWLSAHFPADAGASGAPIALAYHVDYWDRLGWVDRFARADFTARQYAGAQARGDAFAYTPQVVLQGRDFPAWRRGGADAALARIAGEAAPADVVLDVGVGAGGETRASARAQVTEPARRARAAVTILYVDSGHVSDVKAGENRGVRLAHDHVVRALVTGAEGEPAVAASFARPAEPGRAPVVVALVEDRATGAVLQAVALPLSSCPR